MAERLNTDRIGAVIAGLIAVRQIMVGEEPALTDGWTIGSEEDCNYCNDWQANNLVGLGHEDGGVLDATSTAVSALRLWEGLPPNLNTGYFVFVRKPEVE